MRRPAAAAIRWFWLLIGTVWYAVWVAELAAVAYAILSTRRELRRKVAPLPDSEQ